MFSTNKKIHSSISNEEIRFLMESGYLSKEMGNHQEAYDIFLGVSALLPSAPEPLAAAASVLLAAGKVDEAVDKLNKALERFPESPFLKAHLGEAYMCKKETSKAKTLFQEALRADPNGPAGEIAKSYIDFIEKL